MRFVVRKFRICVSGELTTVWTVGGISIREISSEKPLTFRRPVSPMATVPVGVAALKFMLKKMIRPLGPLRVTPIVLSGEQMTWTLFL